MLPSATPSMYATMRCLRLSHEASKSAGVDSIYRTDSIRPTISRSAWIVAMMPFARCSHFHTSGHGSWHQPSSSFSTLVSSFTAAVLLSASKCSGFLSPRVTLVSKASSVDTGNALAFSTLEPKRFTHERRILTLESWSGPLKRNPCARSRYFAWSAAESLAERMRTSSRASSSRVRRRRAACTASEPEIVSVRGKGKSKFSSTMARIKSSRGLILTQETRRSDQHSRSSSFLP
mmetsp:Transcript_1439/g.3078  ORF Transcript_1439/g.3078 Transcript_1439/m.3078 type:complete len:234 (+) Transcript_1439:626-1327(+)